MKRLLFKGLALSSEDFNLLLDTREIFDNSATGKNQVENQSKWHSIESFISSTMSSVTFNSSIFDAFLEWFNLVTVAIILLYESAILDGASSQLLNS